MKDRIVIIYFTGYTLRFRVICWIIFLVVERKINFERINEKNKDEERSKYYFFPFSRGEEIFLCSSVSFLPVFI